MRSIRRELLLKVSYVMITAKGDFPYFGRPDLHLFTPTLESFKRQTLSDVELIIVDGDYERRKDYFVGMDLPFTVKHVPAKPNIFLENNLPGVSAQFNRGIIHSDGELLFFGVDGFMFGSDFMEKLWSRYQEGYFPWAWYMVDWGCSTEEKNAYGQGIMAKDLGLSYSFSGYTGESVVPDQRFNYFKDKDADYSPPWTWWYCCSSASLEAVLAVNGWDQKLDGDRTLMDVDLGSRLEIARFGVRATLFRDLFMVRAPSASSMFKASSSIKCNYGLIELSRNLRRYEANCHKISDNDIGWIKDVFCEGLCGSREFCKKNHKFQYPFEHKKVDGHLSCRKWFNFWKDHQELIDLRVERELRLSGKKYQEGTFIG